MTEDGKSEVDKLETHYPGISGQQRSSDAAVLPSCPKCGSKDTARVNVGITGRTMGLAASSKKFKLIPNGPKPGEYFCNSCEVYFD